MSVSHCAHPIEMKAVFEANDKSILIFTSACKAHYSGTQDITAHILGISNYSPNESIPLPEGIVRLP